MSQDLRRHRRVNLPSSVRVSWQDGGAEKYARGRCLDVSASGLRIEVPERIPVRTYVTVSADQPHFNANASVRHCTRAGSKYVLGLEFSYPIKTLLERLRAEHGPEETAKGDGQAIENLYRSN